MSKSNISLSVESALESFDFLEEDLLEETETTPRSDKSTGSGCVDTGYNSTDDFTKENGETSLPEKRPSRAQVLQAVSNVNDVDISKEVCISDIISEMPGSPLHEKVPSDRDIDSGNADILGDYRTGQSKLGVLREIESDDEQNDFSCKADNESCACVESCQCSKQSSNKAGTKHCNSAGCRSKEQRSEGQKKCVGCEGKKKHYISLCT